jgi:hypothetical protein
MTGRLLLDRFADSASCEPRSAWSVGVGSLDTTSVHCMCAAPVLSAAVNMKVLLPVSAWPGVPVRVREVLSRESHAGCPDKLYMRVTSPGANVEPENWKLYGWLMRAAVGTCELNGKTAAGIADVVASSRLVQSKNFIPTAMRPTISDR